MADLFVFVKEARNFVQTCEYFCKDVNFEREFALQILQELLLPILHSISRF